VVGALKNRGGLFGKLRTASCWRTVWLTMPATRTGVRTATLTQASASALTGCGPELPMLCLTSSEGGRGSGVMSSRISPSPAPETPSTIEWCILVSVATRPFCSPSITHSSQSGRDRSSL
jgi:hypothetical protein